MQNRPEWPIILEMLDPIDMALIQLLETNATLSSSELAEQLPVSPTTIRRRIRKLTQSLTLRQVAFVDPRKIGFTVVALIAFTVVPGKLKSVVEGLAARPETRWVATTTGRFDVLALALFHSTDELAHFLQSAREGVEGLLSSETFICLEISKGVYRRV